ncbi:MAG: 3-deoxy-8-phosphooctulonate synthase [Thermodesulfobacteriota bacterium]
MQPARDMVTVARPDGTAFTIGDGSRLTLIAGPCVLESMYVAETVASFLKELCGRLGIDYIFKASFDKANRTSLSSFRGPGMEEGLEMLGHIRRTFGVPVVADIHDPGQAKAAAAVLDVLQIPAFLCRQTDLLLAAAETGKPVNLKKGQFVSPWDMRNAVEKMHQTGNRNILLTERGATFGYNNLVVDMRALPVMRELGCPVVFDATHSVQLPGGAGTSSGGQLQFVEPLARAATAAGIDALFTEVHPAPESALCDGPNSMPLQLMEPFLRTILAIHRAVA